MTVTADDMVEAVLRPIMEALKDQGLTPAYLTKKLKRELNAKVTKRTKVKGAIHPDNLAKGHKIVAESGVITHLKDGEETYGDGDTVIQTNEIDWPTRQKARQDAHKLRGDYAPDKHIFPDKQGEPQDITGLSNLEMATKLLNLAIKRKEAADGNSSAPGK